MRAVNRPRVVAEGTHGGSALRTEISTSRKSCDNSRLLIGKMWAVLSATRVSTARSRTSLWEASLRLSSSRNARKVVAG